MAGAATVAVFADCGKTRYRALNREAGLFLAQRKVKLIIAPEGREFPRDLVEAALENSGQVLAVAAAHDMPANLPPAVETLVAPSRSDALRTIGELAGILIGLPGDLNATAALYAAWTGAGGAQSGKPVGLLNRKRAFEVVRGFVGDVASVGLGGRTDHLIQFSETFEDLWMRLDRLRG